MAINIRRRELTAMLGAVAAWPLVARAQQPALPVVGFIRDGSTDPNARYVAAFRKGLNETGYVEGQNVTVEYHWLEGQYDRLPALMARDVPKPDYCNGSKDAIGGRPSFIVHILSV